MTALRPTETSRVRGVASERYPVNKKCAHPECDEPATIHHIFPRSLIKSDSYFVEIVEENEDPRFVARIIPHAVGLCGSGTTGHHGDVEEHRAWIKLLDDGVYEWWERSRDDPLAWTLLGPLNPQPGSVEGKPKRKKRSNEPARNKTVYSIRVPKDEAENGYEVLDTLIDEVRDKYGPELGWTETAPPYFVIVAALARALQ